MPEERAEKLAGQLGEFFLFTFASQVKTIPNYHLSFSRGNLACIVCHTLILPLQALVMIKEFLSRPMAIPLSSLKKHNSENFYH